MTDRRKMLEAEPAKLLETLRIFQSTYIRDMALSNVLGKALTALTNMREALRTVQLAKLNGLFDAATANQINGDVDGVFAQVDAALKAADQEPPTAPDAG